ncbi:MAG: hypothetical protein H6999_06355 [Hahellaceae bacterium]|nr:hypothetical protein [Hahellaceae bacterium]MCP5169363.1 hypothetical protein [Hahellaceae bacterium]
MLLEASWLATLAAMLVILGLGYTLGGLLDRLIEQARSARIAPDPTMPASVESSGFIA